MTGTHITPKNYKRYVGYPVVLIHPTSGATLDGILIGITSKGTTIELEDETRTTRRGWVVAARLLTTNEVAAQFGISAIQLRHQLRKHGAGVGKGVKYGFDPVDVATMAAWFARKGL